MKIKTLAFAVATLGLSLGFSACNTNSEPDDLEFTLTHQSDNAFVAYGPSDAMTLATAPTIAAKVNLTKMVSTLTVTGLTYGNGLSTSFTLEGAKTTMTSTGLLQVKQPTLTVLSAGGGNITINDFEYSMVMIQNFANIYSLTYTMSGNIDGHYFRVAPNAYVMYGKTVADSGNNYPFSTYDSQYGVVLDRSTGLAKLMVKNPAFAQAMVGKVNQIQAEKIPFTVGRNSVNLAIESVVPDVVGGTEAAPTYTPWPDYALNELKVNLAYAQSGTVSFYCDNEKIGRVAVTFAGFFTPAQVNTQSSDAK